MGSTRRSNKAKMWGGMNVDENVWYWGIGIGVKYGWFITGIDEVYTVILKNWWDILHLHMHYNNIMDSGQNATK